MQLCVSAFISRVTCLAKCELTILEWNRYERLGDKREQLTFFFKCSRRPHDRKIGRLGLTSLTGERLQNVETVQNCCFHC